MPTKQQLLSELNTDPNGLGYAPLLAAKNDQGIANLLNAVGVGAAYSIYRKSVGVREMIAVIVPADFTALTAVQCSQLELLFLGTATLDATDVNTRTVVQTIFTGKTTTLANFAVLVKRQGSRAEVLWGDGTTIADIDVYNARQP